MDKTLQIQIANNEQQNQLKTLLKISDYKLRFFHWFAIGSKTIAHWTLYFSGPESIIIILKVLIRNILKLKVLFFKKKKL